MTVLGLEEKDDRLGRAAVGKPRDPVRKAISVKTGHPLLEASFGFFALLLIMIAALGLRALWSLGHLVL